MQGAQSRQDQRTRSSSSSLKSRTQIDQGPSGKSSAAKIAEEQKKLDSNIAIDKKSAGQASQAIDFQG